MSIEDVTGALERVQARMKERAGDYSLCSRLSIIEFSSTLHWWLVKKDVDKFTSAAQELQQKSPLAMRYLMSELFTELGCKEHDDLMAHLSAKT